LAAKNNLNVELSPEAKSFVAGLGYDPQFGARPLKRILQKYITNPLSEKILLGTFKAGDHIEVIKTSDSLDFARVEFVNADVV